MRRNSVAVILLMLLVLADIVLVTGAVRSTHVDTSKLAQAQPDPADTENDLTPTGTTGAPSTSTSPTRKLPSGKIIITGVTATRAWRAVTSSTTCHSGASPATIGHTEDRGHTWTRVTVPMATVSGLSFVGRNMIATGLDTSCRPVIYSLSSANNPAKVSAAAPWSVDPSSPAKLLVAGTPVVEQPCTTGVADLAANSASGVVVLCGDGSVESSTDSGASWKRATGPSQVAAIATGGADNTVYAAVHTACGISVGPITADHAGSCVPNTKKWSDPVDMTIVGGTMWLATADATITEQVSSPG